MVHLNWVFMKEISPFLRLLKLFSKEFSAYVINFRRNHNLTLLVSDFISNTLELFVSWSNRPHLSILIFAGASRRRLITGSRRI